MKKRLLRELTNKECSLIRDMDMLDEGLGSDIELDEDDDIEEGVVQTVKNKYHSVNRERNLKAAERSYKSGIKAIRNGDVEKARKANHEEFGKISKAANHGNKIKERLGENDDIEEGFVGDVVDYVKDKRAFKNRSQQYNQRRQELTRAKRLDSKGNRRTPLKSGERRNQSVDAEMKALHHTLFTDPNRNKKKKKVSEIKARKHRETTGRQYQDIDMGDSVRDNIGKALNQQKVKVRRTGKHAEKGEHNIGYRHKSGGSIKKLGEGRTEYIAGNYEYHPKHGHHTATHDSGHKIYQQGASVNAPTAGLYGYRNDHDITKALNKKYPPKTNEGLGTAIKKAYHGNRVKHHARKAIDAQNSGDDDKLKTHDASYNQHRETLRKLRGEAVDKSKKSWDGGRDPLTKGVPGRRGSVAGGKGTTTLSYDGEGDDRVMVSKKRKYGGSFKNLPKTDEATEYSTPRFPKLPPKKYNANPPRTSTKPRPDDPEHAVRKNSVRGVLTKVKRKLTGEAKKSKYADQNLRQHPWFDPTDMRSPEKQKAAYDNNVSATNKINKRKLTGEAEQSYTGPYADHTPADKKKEDDANARWRANQAKKNKPVKEAMVKKIPQDDPRLISKKHGWSDGRGMGVRKQRIAKAKTGITRRGKKLVDPRG